LDDTLATAARSIARSDPVAREDPLSRYFKGCALNECSERARTASLFKHSTRCPISAQASRQLDSFQQEHPDLPIAYARVLVVENRPASRWLAQRLGVEYASPQITLIARQNAVWKASHYAITAPNIGRAVRSALGKDI